MKFVYACLAVLFMQSYCVLCDSNSSQQYLTCISCDIGQYLYAFNHTHARCRACPDTTSTDETITALSPHDCECVQGMFAYENACEFCVNGSYKADVGNETCTFCPQFETTHATGSISLDQCVCRQGFTHKDTLSETSVTDCVPCEGGTKKNFIGDEPCVPCLAGFYCPTQSIESIQCPSNSSSPAQSSSENDCKCLPGFYEDRTLGLTCHQCPPGTYNEFLGQAQCQSCPRDTFQPHFGMSDKVDCQNCPANTDTNSAQRVTTQTGCFCKAGYSGLPGGPCTACKIGEYRDASGQQSNNESYICEACPGGTYNDVVAATSMDFCQVCPNNTFSLPRSGSIDRCVCVAGYFYDDDDATFTCTECAAGSFQPETNSSACHACPAGTFSTVTAAVSSQVCQQCADGFYNTLLGAVTCLPCASNTWQNLSVSNTHALECSACPANSLHNLSAQTDIESCRCQAGYAAVDNGTDYYRCELCLPGFYCPGDGKQFLCELNHFSQPGSTVCTPCHPNSQGEQIQSEEECLCKPGTQGRAHDTCSLCAAGKFQALLGNNVTCEPCDVGFYQNNTGSTECQKCANNSLSGQGSDDITDCVCNPKFHGPNGGPCELCESGTFCPGGTTFQNCRQHSTSAPGQVSQNACDCIPGYYSRSESSTCLKCPPNSYCPGDLLLLNCSAHSFSRAGSSSIEQCICGGGTWRGCVMLPNGTAYNNAGRCEIDYNLPCTTCEADSICVNNTLQHCPDFSSAPAGSDHPFDCVCDSGYRTVLTHHDSH